MTFTNRIAPPSVTLVPGTAHSALQGLGAPDALPASPSPGAAVPRPWTPPAAAEQVAMVRPIVQGLRWAVKNPRVMRAVIDWVEKKTAQQAATRLAARVAPQCANTCSQAMRNAMRKAAAPGAAPSAARSPEQLATELNRLVGEEFAKVAEQVPKPVRLAYEAAARDAIDSGVKAVAHTVRTAVISGTAGALGKAGWDGAAQWLRQANHPETPEDIRLLREIRREIGGLRQDLHRPAGR